MQLGVASEQEGDDSAAGLRARFTPLERLYGRAWEKFAHLDTPWHTKFMQVRSAFEHYEREQVYGTRAGSWQHPVNDWILPTMDAAASRSLLWGPLTGAFVGSLFGKTRLATGIGAGIGGAVGLTLSGARILREHLSGKPRIPRRVTRRRDVEEYVNTLKYVRAERLYAQESEAARREEGVDIAGLLEKEDREGRRYKGRLWELEREKRDARLFESDPEEAHSRHYNAQAEIKAMNAARGYSHKAGPHSARAVILHSEIHSTLQGYEKGDPLPQALSALPRYEREIAQDIITNGDRREKRRFYRLLPDAEKRVLGAYLGARENVPERKDLAEYFSKHTLPGVDWQGWREDFDLSAVRAIAAKEEKIALSDMSLFPRQIQEAEVLTENVPVPTVWGKTRDIRGTLEDLLSGRGVSHVRVDLQVSPSHHHSKFQVEADLHHDRTDDYARQLR